MGRSRHSSERDADPALTSGLFTPDARFAPIARLGRGAMGVVYEVFDRERGMRMALKELRRLTPRGILQFKDEFRAVRDIRHRNLVRLGELFEDAGRWYFTMELVEGVDFLRHVRPGADPRSTDSARPPAPATPAATPADTIDADATAATLADAAGEPDPASLTGTTIREPSAPRASGSAPGETIGAEPRAPVEFDEARLRAALAQLVLGVTFLHRAGKVHRDIKGSNIVVADDGRVVLLDFGVVADLERGYDRGQLVGTAAYMAPEQADGRPVTPAADWYAVGVLLYRALTGRLPFRGAVPYLLAAKRALPPPPSRWVAGLPADLEHLCMSLLAPDPGARPDDAAMLELVGGGPAAPPEQAMPFVGRTAELAAIEEAHRDARCGVQVIVAVSGPSGVGKTMLVEQAVARLHEQLRRDGGGEMVVLRGRCHEREAVPFRAFDGVIDDLAHYLLRDDAPRLPSPAHVASLLRLFPALGVALAHAGDEITLDAASARAHAFAALAALLEQLTRRVPVVLVIDDAQWADADSLALLDALTATDPAPPILILATLRDGAAARAVLGRIACEVRALSLAGLSQAEARALTERLAGARSDPAAIDALVAEAAGHPMFLAELIRQRRAGAAATALGLDAALCARAERLPAAARRVVQLVVVAGAPVSHASIARAAGVDGDEYAACLDRLVAAHLARADGARARDRVEPYHDRVREALYDALAPEVRAELHLRLGQALRADGAPAQALVRHFELGGDPASAAEAAEAAADRAVELLAFERAAELYARALALGEHGPERRAALQVARGRALQNAGRAREAADAYAEAASLTGGAARLDLTRRSAEQLLMGGHVRAGKAAAADVLAPLGMRLPASQLGTLVRLLLLLARFRLGRLRWRERAEDDCDPVALHRVDACWSVGAGLCMVDTVVGMYYATVGLRQVLPLGEPFRVARAACTVAVVASTVEQGRLAARMCELSARAARVHGSELADFYAQAASVVRTFLIEHDWPGAETRARAALDGWRRAGMGRGFESDFLTQFETWSMAMRGALDAERRVVEARVRDAARAGNRFLEVSLRVFHHQPHVLRDDPARGREDIADAIAGWLDEDAFQLPHCWSMISMRNLDVYEGRLASDPEQRAAGRRLRLSPFWQVGFVRCRFQDVQARAALVAAADSAQRGVPSEARRARRRARALARALARHRTPVPRLWSRLIVAGVHACAGREDAAAEVLRALIPSLDEAGCELHAACGRHRLSALVGGSEGASLRAAATEWFDRRGVVAPARLVAAIAPGWRD